MKQGGDLPLENLGVAFFGTSHSKEWVSIRLYCQPVSNRCILFNSKGPRGVDTILVGFSLVRIFRSVILISDLFFF